jgi:hypothetical protein
MRHLIYILWVLLLTSCGTTYQLSTINHDPIYASDGTEIQFDVVDNEFQLARKFRTDDKFRWDFAQFAMKQDLRWNYDFYFNNRMYRSPYASPFDFYWNSHNYWWNWATNSHFNMGFNHWDRFGFYGYGSSFGYYGFNRYGWNNGYYGNGWGYRQRMNDYAWNNRDRENTAYILGRRGSSNVIVGNRTNIENRIIVNRNKPRIINNNPDVVIDRAIIKLKRNNNNIRVYENPNNVPNKIIIRNNNNSKPVRNYNRTENNSNNNIIRNNRPSRTYTPPSRSSSPPVISRPPTRSSNPPVISRGSGGSRGSVKN